MMETFQSIETRRTIIRRLIHADQEKLMELLCDPSVTNNMSFTEEMKTPTGAKDLLAMTIKSYDTKVPLLAYAIEDASTGEFIGVTGLNPLEEHNIEVFYALLPAYWHKGFASE
ncbi:MAG: GNAT family N-acetyltransferase, partial [Cytophagales bacterium]|nr:GNAT family N-acetyltransferase [Cytophagales bacterium]